MNKTIGNEYNTQNNAFNLLRFIFASMVISFHSYLLFYGTSDVTVSEFLSHLKELSWETLVDFLLVINGYCGTIAVNGFFAVSGFLITQSLLQTENTVKYLMKRGLRIYPALIASVVGSVLIGTFFTNMNLRDYLFKGTESGFDFIVKNLTLLTGIQSNIQDVFSSNKLPSVNGSLWTLPYEAWFYIGLLFLFLTRFPLKRLVPLCAVVTNVMFIIMNISGNMINFGLINIEFFRLSSFFLNGAVIYLYKDYISNNRNVFLVMMLIFAISPVFKIGKYLSLIALPYIVIWLAVNFKLSPFEKFGDFSYGLYIYSMPIQQAVLGVFKLNMAAFTVVSWLTTLVVSVVSWHFLEKPVLNLKKYLVKHHKKDIYYKIAG